MAILCRAGDPGLIAQSWKQGCATTLVGWPTVSPASIHGRQHAPRYRDPACVPRRDRLYPRPSDRYGALPSRELRDRPVGGHIVETIFRQFRLRRVGIRQHLKALAPDRSRQVFYAMVRQSGVPIPSDDCDTPDMSEVARIAWAATQTIRWPPPTKSELTMVIDHHTAPARFRAPTAVHFPYFTAAQTARRRAKVGIRRNGSS